MSQHSVVFDEEVRHAVYVRDGYKCAYCGRHDVTYSGAGLSLDHIQARAEGGAPQNTKGAVAHGKAENLVTACGPCNSVKQEKSPRAFNVYLKAQGKPIVEWEKVRAQANRPINIRQGSVSATKAKAFRDEAMRRLGVTNVKQLQSIAGRGELQEKLAEHAAGTERPHGPGICHDEQGRFTACRLAALTLARLIRTRLAIRRGSYPPG